MAAIQSDTSGAIAAIEEIGHIIQRVGDYQLTIASAVQEQAATTSEMGRNVTEAAMTSNQIAQTITSVAATTPVTTEGVSQARAATRQLASMATDLKQLLGRFRC